MKKIADLLEKLLSEDDRAILGSYGYSYALSLLSRNMVNVVERKIRHNPNLIQEIRFDKNGRSNYDKKNWKKEDIQDINEAISKLNKILKNTSIQKFDYEQFSNLIVILEEKKVNSVIEQVNNQVKRIDEIFIKNLLLQFIKDFGFINKPTQKEVFIKKSTETILSQLKYVDGKGAFFDFKTNHKNSKLLDELGELIFAILIVKNSFINGERLVRIVDIFLKHRSLK